jgi:hypothetical protein
MKLRIQMVLAAGALLWLTGCASIGAPLPPSLELPKAPTDLRAVRKGDKVTLTWSVPALTTDRQKVRYVGKTHVCRGPESVLTACGTPVADADPPANLPEKDDAKKKKLTASYVDSISPEVQRLQMAAKDNLRSNPFATITYAVEVLNRDGRSAGLSNQVHVPLVQTQPAPADLAARLTAQGAVLTWTGKSLPSTDAQPVHFRYRVFRRAEGQQKQTLVGEVEAGADTLSLTDQSFEWEKNYYYHADSVTILSQAGKPDITIEGDDTPEVKVFAHDVFPPAVPAGLQAVFSGPGQAAFIDLIWAPVTDADLAGYNIYRHQEGEAAVKMNAELVKTPAYRDVQVAAGKKYFYAVSAVDVRGNESAQSEEASESVP